MTTSSNLSRLAQLSIQEQHAHLSPEILLLRLPELLDALQLSRASVYARLKPGGKYFDPTFPRPIVLSPSGRGGVAWLAREVAAWIKQQIEKRDGAIASTKFARKGELQSIPAAKSVHRSPREKSHDADDFFPDVHSTRKVSAIGH